MAIRRIARAEVMDKLARLLLFSLSKSLAISGRLDLADALECASGAQSEGPGQGASRGGHG